MQHFLSHIFSETEADRPDQNFRPPLGRSSSSSGGVKPCHPSTRQIEHWVAATNCCVALVLSRLDYCNSVLFRGFSTLSYAKSFRTDEARFIQATCIGVGAQ